MQILFNRAIEWRERHEDRWYFSEIFRIKSKLLSSEDNGNHVLAEQHLAQSLNWSRRQGSRSWELRTALSFAELRRNEGHTNEAQDILRPVYERSTKGFDTADLRQARAPLD